MRLTDRTYLKVVGMLCLIDGILLPTCYYLASKDVTSLWIAIPMYILNLPALPLAVIYAMVLSDPLSLLTAVTINASLVLVSSVVWGEVIVRRIKKRTKKA